MRTIQVRVPRLRWLAILAAIFVLPLTMASSCGGSDSNQGQSLENTASNQNQTIAEQTDPAPVFKYSNGRWVLTEAEASIALGEQTTSFFFQQGNPNPIGSCPSIGYPVANTAQLTNPQKIVNDTGSDSPTGGAALTIGNMDPYQYYPPTGSEGTYVLCVNRGGEPYLYYSEPNVITVAGAAIWVAGKGVVLQGSPNMPSCKVLNSGTKKAKTICTK